FRPSDNEDGQVQYLSENDPFPGKDKQIFQKVQVVDNGIAVHSLSLGPKEQKKLQLRVVVPKDEPLSDYYFSIIFLGSPQADDSTDSPQDQSNVSNAQAGVAMNVLLSIGQTDQPKAYLQEFSAPLYLESGPVPFTVRV